MGAGAGARRRRLHRQPAARRATRSSRWSAAAEAAGAGVFALVRTSNPGAADLAGPAGTASGRCTSAWRRSSTGSRQRLARSGGLSGMGAVVGATEPGHIARLRELMPRVDLPDPRRRRPGRPARSCSAPPSRRARPRPWSPPRAASPATPIPAAAAERLRARRLGSFDQLNPCRRRLYDPRPISRSALDHEASAPQHLARVLAVIALVGGVVGLVVVIATSLGGGTTAASSGKRRHQKGRGSGEKKGDKGRRRRPTWSRTATP